MLKVMRDNLKYLSWVLWLVIAVFILFVFVDFGGTVPTAGPGTSNAAVSVGKHEITFAEFERAYRQAENLYRQAYGERFSAEFARQLGLPGQVIDGLVADKILLDEARRMGLDATDEEVRRRILTFGAFQNPDGGFVGAETYNRILRQNGFTAESFEGYVREELLVEKVRTVLQENVFVPDAEVERAYRERVERAKVQLLKLPATRFEEQIEDDPEALAAWFEANAETFRVPERRVARYLTVDRAALQATLEIDDAAIQTYYDENRDQYETDEQVRARHILVAINDQRTAEQAEAELLAVKARLDAGESFEALAAELSEDPGSKERGGDLGFFGRGAMVPPFEEAAFSAEPGVVVGPVKSSFGAHLIEVIDKRPAGLRPLDEAREEIRTQLQVERSRTLAENKAQELVERIRSENVVDPAAFEALAEGEAGVTFETTPAFGEEENLAGLGRASAFHAAVFELAAGGTAAPVKIGRGWAIPQLVSIEEARIPELDEVRDDATTAWRAERRLELAKERLAAAREAIAGGEKSLDEVASELGVEIEEPAEFGAGGPVGSLGTSRRAAKAAMAMEPGEIGGPFAYEGGAAIFAVVERKRFEAGLFTEAKGETREGLEQQRFGELLTTLVNERRAELGVRYHPDLVANFELQVGA